MKRISGALASLILLLPLLLCSCGGSDEAQALEKLQAAMTALAGQEGIHTQEETTFVFSPEESQTQLAERWYFQGNYLYRTAYRNGETEEASASYLKWGDRFYIRSSDTERWAETEVPDPALYAPYGANLSPETMEWNILSFEQDGGGLSITCDNLADGTQSTGDVTVIASTATYTLDGEGALRSIVTRSTLRGTYYDGSEYEVETTFTTTYLDTDGGQLSQIIGDAAAQAQADAG